MSGPRGPYRRPAGQTERAAELYRAGWAWQDIAADLGVTVETARTRLHEAGVPLDRAVPRWEVARGWPWPLTLEEVALRLYGQADAQDRRRARSVVGNWLDRGWLIRVGWGRYGQPPEPES